VNQTLRIGKITFLNLAPVYRELERLCAGGAYEFVGGHPAELNRMLQSGSIQISASSSIQYLRDTATYTYLPGHSISARGPVQSILLFSRMPIEDIIGLPIVVTHQSETSVALLDVLLKEFYGFSCELKVSPDPFEQAMQDHAAYLSIGDEALRARARAHVMDTGEQTIYTVCTIDHQAYYCYDLSTLWFHHTGKPFVFALWTLRRSLLTTHASEVERFTALLDQALAAALANLADTARATGSFMTSDELLRYWQMITYGLPPDCVEGLELFRRLIARHRA